MELSAEADHSTVIQATSPRQRLLAATENILLEQGFHALSTRAISTAAETNISQIRYYFDSMEGLLEALLQEEIEAVSAAFAALTVAGGRLPLPALMAMLHKALKTPALYTRQGFAAVAIEAIYHHVSDGMRARAAHALEAAHGPFRSAIAAQIPDMDQLTIKVRLAGIIAMAMSMLPRGTGLRLLQVSGHAQELDEDSLDGRIRALMVAAWS